MTVLPCLFCFLKFAYSHVGNWPEIQVKVCPGNRAEKPRSQQPSQPTISYEHIKIFTKDLVHGDW